MNCKSVANNLSAYIDQELSGREMLEIREHLRTCSACASEEAALRELKAMLGAFRDAEPPACLDDKILVTIHRERSLPRLPAWAVRSAQFAALAACAMAATMGVLRIAAPSAAPAQDISFDVQRDQVWSNSMPGSMTIPTANYGP